jgi:hypothetical protein
MKNFNRRFCVIEFFGNTLLSIPNGYYAGNVFESGLSKSNASGQSFGVITGDDNKKFVLSKHEIEEVTDKEIIILLEDKKRLLHPDFKIEANKLLALKPIRPNKKWKK